MPAVFLSHKHEEKAIVLKIQERLTSRLLETWIDKTDLPGVDRIWNSILKGIRDCKYFIPFLSAGYCSSNPCLHEFQQAHAKAVEKKLFIIPVMNGDVDNILSQIHDQDTKDYLGAVINSSYWVRLDEYDIKKTADQIASIISKEEGFYFNPVTEVNANGQKMQLIEFAIDNRKYSDGFLPPDFLKEWTFKLQPFLSENDTDNKIIKIGMPILLNGRAPNWIYTFLSIPFHNNRTVYVYNNQTSSYVCVYCLRSGDASYVGKNINQSCITIR